MKTNRNKGFSMIELIVVVAIIGIFTALASISFNYLKSGNVKAAAKTIDSTLSKLKLDTMSKEAKPYMCLYREGNYYYMFCTTADKAESPSTTNGEKIGNGNVKITINNSKTIAEGEVVYIAFKKGSGAFTEEVKKSSGDITTVHDGISDSDATIMVERADGSGTKYTIHMIKDTGKHYITIN